MNQNRQQAEDGRELHVEIRILHIPRDIRRPKKITGQRNKLQIKEECQSEILSVATESARKIRKKEKFRHQISFWLFFLSLFGKERYLREAKALAKGTKKDKIYKLWT